MQAPLKNTKTKKSNTRTNAYLKAASGRFHHLTFDNTLQANIIFKVTDGKLLAASTAACYLLGYSKKVLLTKKSSDIVDLNNHGFKKMLKKKSINGSASRLVTFIKKNGKRIICEASSAIFKDYDGAEKGIIAFMDTSAGIARQRIIDSIKEKIVIDNIAMAKAKQQAIDIKNAKKVANDIALAISRQIKIDVKKEKIVAANIALAKAKQINIDIKKAKKVADDIVAAISKQIKIDAIKEKIVKENILLAISKQKNIDAGNAEVVTQNIIRAISNQKAIDKAKDKIVADNILLAFQKSEAEKLEFEKTLSDKLAMEFKDRLQLTLHSTDHVLRKLSFDKSIHPNLVSTALHGKIELVNKAACKLLGYSKEELLTKSRKDIVDINEQGFKKMLLKRNAKGESTGVVTFINKKGKRIPCEIFSAVFTDQDGIEKTLVSFTNISRQNALQGKLNEEITNNKKLLLEIDENFKLIFNSSSDVLYDSNMETDRLLISNAYEKEYGYEIKNNMTPLSDWISHIHPEDKEAVSLEFQRVLVSEEMEWKHTYRFLRADGGVVNVVSKAVILRNPAGKAYRVIGSMQDMNKQKVLEEKLQQEIKLKEKQIIQAMEEAQDSARSEIGKELHDNINQLLGASKLYLEMAKQGGANTKAYISRSSEYTLEAIEEIRKLTKGLTTDKIKYLGLCESIDNICRDTMEVHPVKITYTYSSFIEEGSHEKFKLNIFRIVQEQINNILKHAKATEVNINLSQNKRSVILTISDNGIGFETCNESKGIGLANIKSRTASYKGTADFISQPGRGCVLITTFPVKDSILNLN